MLEEIRQVAVDLIVVGGDVLPGPMPRETIGCLPDLDLPVQFIQGNGDGVETDRYHTAPEQWREPFTLVRAAIATRA